MQAQGCPVVRLGRVLVDWLAGSYIVEFDMPAYPGLYLSFQVVFPYQAQGLGAFHKQLAATTNNTGNFTSSLGYFIMGLA